MSRLGEKLDSYKRRKSPEKNKVIDFEDIAKDYADKGEHVLLRVSRAAEADGLGGDITLISRDNYNNFLEGETFDDFREQIGEFELVQYEEFDDSVVISFFNGYRDAEMVWKFYNIPVRFFEDLLKNYIQIENITEE